MSFCIVENDVIVNIVEASAEYAASQGWIENQGWVIGWVSDGAGGFVPPAAPESLEPVPEEVARYACLMALERHTLEDGVLSEVDPSLPEPENSLLQNVLALYAGMTPGLEKSKMRDALERVLHWLRASPSVEIVRQALGLTHAQVDVLFRWAKAYEATI